jgi:hypothetical protein
MRTRRFAVPLVLLPVLSIMPAPGRAQSHFMVEGRVIEPTGRGIENALVELEGSRQVLSSAGGFFRIQGVARGEWTLHVEAFGYVGISRDLVVDGDTTLTVALDIAPFALDSLVVSPKRIDVEGRVRGFEGERELRLANADVVTTQGQTTRTNGRGGFKLTGWQGTPLQVEVRAFGYMPLDTILVPEERQKYDFLLEPDLVVKRMIAAAVRRLETRAHPLLAVTMRPLNREDLLRNRALSLDQLLHYRYGSRLHVACVVLDERALSPEMADGVLTTMFAEEVERIELLFRGRMLRIYTRAFMRTLLGGGRELADPVYVSMAHPPFCR